MANPRWLVVGAKGMLGGALCRIAGKSFDIVPLDLPDFDMTDQALVERVFADQRPAMVINCAAYTDVDACETKEELAHKVNADGPLVLAQACKKVGAGLVHISTDYVFSGNDDTAYTEDSPTGPINAYGRSKLAGDLNVAGAELDKWFIIRTSWLYGPGGKNFVDTIANLAMKNKELRVVNDQFGSPTFSEDLVNAIITLAQSPSETSGIYHFTNEGKISWFDFASKIVENIKKAGLPVTCETITPVTSQEFIRPAKRPAMSELSKKKYTKTFGKIPPTWSDSLSFYLAEYFVPNFKKAEGNT